MTNPLLAEWTGPFGLPPFDAIEDADFGPALEAALAEDLAEVVGVADAAEPPTFANTIEGLMCCGATLDRVTGVFFNLAGSDSTPAREALMREYSPKLAAHAAAIYGNRPLFDRIRSLFDDLERKRDIAEFLELTESGEGVRIFIGSENKLFSLSGSSLVVSPYMNADRKIIGAVGVIGPTRLNYGRIVPIVDYTAQLVGKLISDRS